MVVGRGCIGLGNGGLRGDEVDCAHGGVELLQRALMDHSGHHIELPRLVGALEERMSV